MERTDAASRLLCNLTRRVDINGKRATGGNLPATTVQTVSHEGDASQPSTREGGQNINEAVDGPKERTREEKIAALKVAMSRLPKERYGFLMQYSPELIHKIRVRAGTASATEANPSSDKAEATAERQAPYDGADRIQHTRFEQRPPSGL